MLKLKSCTKRSIQQIGVSSKYWSQEASIEDCKELILNDVAIGIIDYDLNDGYLDIQMIELFDTYRNRGIGSIVISELFNLFNLKAIRGESANSAIPFWYSLGADFEMSYNKLVWYYNMGYSACFILYRR